MAVEKGKILLGIGVAAVVVAGAVCFSDLLIDDSTDNPSNGSALSQNADASRGDSINSKSNSNSKSSQNSADTNNDSSKDDSRARKIDAAIAAENDYGRIKPVSSKDNPAAKSILEAHKSGQT